MTIIDFMFELRVCFGLFVDFIKSFFVKSGGGVKNGHL